jgi:hypothetical protein
MDDLPQSLDEVSVPAPPKRPSLLVRAAVYTLVPVLIVAALPLLLLIILVLYLLAMLQGARVFVFSWSSKQDDDTDIEVQKPHFLEMQEPRAITDQAKPPAKG